MTNPLAQDLGGVVRLLEKATPGEWPEPEASRFVPDKFNVGDSAPYTLVGRDEDDLRAAVASVNFLRTHAAEIAGALRFYKAASENLPPWQWNMVHDHAERARKDAMQQGGGGGE